MKEKSLWKEYAKMTVLSILGMLGVSCYLLADTFFVATGLGKEGLAALNLAIPVYNFIHGTGLMLGMGGATGFSIRRGRQESAELNPLYTTTLLLGLGFGLIFAGVGIFGAEELASLLGADRITERMTTVYLRWLLIFAPAFICNDILLCFVRNDGSPRLATAGMLVGSFSNILLDALFIFPLEMGMFGAVFATGLSPIISVLTMLPHWLGKRNTLSLCPSLSRPRLTGELLALGFPSFVAQASGGLVMILFNMLILREEGNIGLAAYGVVANVSLVIIGLYTGVAQGMQPLLSRFHGAGNRPALLRTLRYGLLTVIFSGILCYLLLFFGATPIAGIFNPEGDAALQRLAEEGVLLYFTAIPFAGLNLIWSVYFPSVERTVPGQVLSLLRGLILILPTAFLFAELLGMAGIWLSFPAVECVIALAGAAVARFSKKPE